MTQLVPISVAAFVNPRFSGAASGNGCEKVSFLPMSGISEQGFIAQTEERGLSEVTKGYTYFERGDVLLAKITPCMENGKAAVVSNLPHQIGFGSTEFHVLRPKPGVDVRFLFYMIWNPVFRYEASHNMTGSAGQKRVPTDFVAGYKIPLPPLPEQRRIAAILDKADCIRRKQEEGIRLTEELLRSTFFDMFGDPATNPRKWDRQPLESLEEPDGIKCGPFGTQLSRAEFQNTGVPLWGIKHVNAHFELPTHEFLSKDKSDELVLYSLCPGDIVMTRKGTIGNCSVYPSQFARGIMHSDLLRLRIDQRKCISEFLSFQLSVSTDVRFQLDRISSGAIMAGINVTKLRSLSVLVPPIARQRDFLRTFSKIADLRNHRRAAATTSNTLFGSLVQRAFQGQLTSEGEK